jgi:HRAS-like suppressor 3
MFTKSLRLNELDEFLSSEPSNNGIKVGSAISITYTDKMIWKLCIYLGNKQFIEIFERGVGIIEKNFKLLVDNINDCAILENLCSSAVIRIKHLLNSQQNNVEYHLHSYNIFDICKQENLTLNNVLSILQYNLEQINTFEEGDIIGFNRSFYHHNGILTDIDRMIITHKSGEPVDPTTLKGAISSMAGFSIDKAEVVEDYLIDVIGRSRILKCNKEYDKCYMPRPKNEIIQEAKRRIGEKGYSITSNNCQHFVSECRNGNSFSHEVTFSLILFFTNKRI